VRELLKKHKTATFSGIFTFQKSLQKANVTKLTENISTLRMNDVVVRLGCSLVDLTFQPVHSERRRSLPLSHLAKPVDQLFVREQTTYAISTVSLETQQLFFSSIQPFPVCKIFIRGRSCSHMQGDVAHDIYLWPFIKENLGLTS